MNNVGVEGYYETGICKKIWQYHQPFATSPPSVAYDWAEGQETASPAIWYDANIDRRLKALESEIAEVKKMARQILNLMEDEAEVMEAREISFENAKEEIARYFIEHDGQRIDCGDLMEELNIAPGLIMRVCDKLEEEKKIASVDQR